MAFRSLRVAEFSLLLTTVIVAVAVTACARPETAADRHFRELGEQVNQLQADHDAEGSGASEWSYPKAGTAAQVPAQPPRVLQLGDSSEADSPDPADPSERPELRMTGSVVGGPSRARSSRLSTRARIDDAESQGIRSGEARPSALDPEAKKAYEQALQLVQTKQYERGISELSAFLVRYPDHPYSENAWFWRGEAYYARAEYARAVEQFEALLARPGSGSKAPDALLKLGMCHERLGAASRARELWDRLKNEYPRSDAAKRIPGRSPEASPKGPKENR